jgi:two-component system, NtrC family, sensor histidine kinase AtoS
MDIYQLIYAKLLRNNQWDISLIQTMKPFLSRTHFNITYLGNILNQISEPCLILDKKNNKVVQVNQKWESLTSFKLDELINNRIEDLLKNDASDLTDPSKSIFLRKRNDSLIECTAQMTYLDKAQGLVLLKIFPRTLSVIKIKDSESLNLKYDELIHLENEENIDVLIQRTVEIINDLYDCFSVSIYSNDHSADSLLKIRNSEPIEIFPKEIGIHELDKNKKLEFWKFGDRTLNEIQRAARANDLSLLVQIMLQITEDFKMFIVITFKNDFTNEGALGFLPVLISIIQNNFLNVLKSEKNIKDKKQGDYKELLLTNIFENIPFGIIINDIDGKIIQTNPYIEKILGYEKWEMLNNSINVILPTINSIKTNFKDPRNILLERININKRDGSQFPASLQSLPLFNKKESDEEGNILILIADLSKITNLETKNTQLDRQAEMGVLMASFAHDVRNVFNSIKLNAETVELKNEGNQEVQEKMVSIKEDCDQINQLMESVLSFSSSIEKNKQQIDVHFLLERIIERWQPKLERFKIKSILQSEVKLPEIPGDPRSLEQVFNNLISNARDAMLQKGGMLGIHLSSNPSDESGMMVEIKISDSGAGIPEEFISKIFDPFFSARPGGTGLGLAITKRIVENHHGRLDVESFPGGTTFTVRLPGREFGEDD